MPDDFKLEDYGLRKCHIKIYEGLIFINLSIEDPMDFDEFMSPLKELVNFHGKVVACMEFLEKMLQKLFWEIYR